MIYFERLDAQFVMNMVLQAQELGRYWEAEARRWYDGKAVRR